jgi:hypothetical protein
MAKLMLTEDQKKRDIEASDNKEKQITEKYYKDETTVDDEFDEYLKKIQGNEQLTSDDDTMIHRSKEDEFVQEEKIADQSHLKIIEHQFRETQPQNIKCMYTYLLYFAYFVRVTLCY